jgi:outer membrane protein OmpA-like peptidoglycan-associated protein
MNRLWVMSLAAVLLAVAPVRAEEPFAKALGDVEVKPYAEANPVVVPYIFWGGDVVTWYANGGKEVTTPDSIYGKMGLHLKLVAGDDFLAQVKSLKSGESPFVRAELRMLVLASEVLNSNASTKLDVIEQLTFSNGDHAVGRTEIKNANDFKGKKIALQKYGPHVGMLDDILTSAGLKWNDIKVVWTKDLSGTDDSPAAVFKKDPSIDVCFVISPDMIGLTGGLRETGSGAEGTVKGSHVVVSTADMSRSLADVYGVTQAFRTKNPDLVKKFVAGFLKATNEVVALRKAYKANPRSPEGQRYTKTVLLLAQNIWGKKALPTLEVDAAGLMDDAAFVGAEGNYVFFVEENNKVGFAEKMKSAMTLAKGQGYTSIETGFSGPKFDYEELAKVAGIEFKIPAGNRQRFNAEATSIGASDTLDEKTLVSFAIPFEPNEANFDPSPFIPDFDKVLQNLSLYGNAKLVVRGHSDPAQTLKELVMGGKEKGLLRENNVQGKRTYFLSDGAVLDLTKTRQIVKMIEGGEFDGGSHSARDTMQAARNLSMVRAEAVRKALIAYAVQKGLKIDPSQIEVQGVGIAEPLVPKPTTMEQVRQNMRVQFSMIRVSGEALKQSDLDF